MVEIIVRKRGNYTPSKNGRSKMSESERRDLKVKEQDLEASINDESFKSVVQDQKVVHDNLKRVKTLLAADDDLTAKGKERGRLESEKKRLEDYIKIEMPPMYLQKAKQGTPEYDEAVRWGAQASRPEVVQKCERYKDICRRLDPTDPNAGSVDTLVSQGVKT